MRRREDIRRFWYFDCQCPRCSDPTELGSYMSAIICFACNLGFLVPTDSCTEGSLWAPKIRAHMQIKLRRTFRILIWWDLNISDTDSQSTKTDVCLLTFAYCLQSTRHNTLLFYQIEPFRNGPFLVLLPVFLTINWQTKQTFL